MRLLFEQQQARFEEQHQAFVADQQTRAAQTQQLLENNNNLAARIDELLRLGQSEQDKRQELERELAEERARSAQSKPLADVSKLGQTPPEKWSFDTATTLRRRTRRHGLRSSSPRRPAPCH